MRLTFTSFSPRKRRNCSPTPSEGFRKPCAIPLEILKLQLELKLHSAPTWPLVPQRRLGLISCQALVVASPVRCECAPWPPKGIGDGWDLVQDRWAGGLGCAAVFGSVRRSRDRRSSGPALDGSPRSRSSRRAVAVDDRSARVGGPLLRAAPSPVRGGRSNDSPRSAGRRERDEGCRDDAAPATPAVPVRRPEGSAPRVIEINSSIDGTGSRDEHRECGLA